MAFLIDIKKLQLQSAAAAWNKALELVASNAVAVKSVTPTQVSAQVQGTENYQVVLHGKNKHLEKLSCDCRAFDFQRSCKHCLAVAIVASGNSALVPLDILKKAEAKQARDTKRQDKVQSEQKLLADFLNSMDKSVLESELLALIKTDKALTKHWLFKAQLTETSSDPKQLKKRVTQALPLKFLYRYDEVDRYFQQAQQSVEEILNAAKATGSDAANTEIYFNLLMDIYKRLDKVFERVDDSGGFRFELMAILDNELEQAFIALSWSDKKKSQWLTKYQNPPFDVFPDVTQFQWTAS